ncbi:MAG: GAF domain-containing protein [Deltaproteobacteria bacterium]|nr:GAF domain-containing protein [Deltaproteobacteria bacterium]
MGDAIARLRKLVEAARSMQAASDPDELCDVVVRWARAVFDLDNCAVLLFEPDGETLRIRAAHGYEPNVVESWRGGRGKGLTGRAVEEGKLVVVGDVTADPSYVEGVSGARSELAAPLLVEGKPIGVLDLESGRAGAFGDLDLALFSSFADQSAAALHNALLRVEAEGKRREAERTAFEMTALVAAGRKLASVLDPERLLIEILGVVRETMRVPRCAVLLVDETTRELVLRKAVGYGVPEGLRIPMGKGVTGEVASTGRPARVGDVSRDGRYIAGVQGGRSEMAVPVRLDSQVVGVLDVEALDPNAFDDSDERLLAALADQVAAALHNANLTGRVGRRAQRLALLSRAGRVIATVLDPDAVLYRILELASEALGFQRCALLLKDPFGADLLVRAALGYGDVVGKRIPSGQGICGTVFRSGTAEVVADVTKDDRYVRGLVGGRTEMAAPLRLDGTIIGVLDAESPQVAAFDADDLDLFSGFASHAAVAIQNAGLHDELERRTAELDRRAHRLAILHKAGQAMATALDPDVVLHEVLKLAGTALAFSRCAVLLLDREKGDLVVRASVGYGDIQGKRIALEGTNSGEVVRDGKGLLIGDVTTDQRYVQGSSGARCEMIAPMKVRGETIGTLDAESPVQGAYDQDDLELLEVFAAHAAASIHNARMFQKVEDANTALRANIKEMERLNRELEQYARQIARANDALERQVRQLLALHRAGQTITSSLDLDTTLQHILAMTRDIIDTSSSTIKLLDVETKELRVRASSGESKQGELMVDVPLRVGDRTIGVFELAKGKAFGEEEHRMLETLASQASIAIENARLFDETQRTYYDTLRSLAGALEARDAYTQGHSERVAKLSMRIAEKLGLPEEDRKEIYSAALLHDIGKIGVRDEVLLKPGRLTPEEMAIIRGHPIFGDAILGPLKFLGKVTGMVKHHHERWDGKGYPDGLKGEDIPLASRIVAIADSFDALTSDRPYRDRKTLGETLRIVEEETGRQFDPQVVKALFGVLGETKSGGDEIAEPS